MKKPSASMKKPAVVKKPSAGKPAMAKPQAKAAVPAAKATKPGADAVEAGAPASQAPAAVALHSDDEVTVILGEQDQHLSSPSPDQVDPAVLDHQDEDPLDFNIRVEDEPSSSSTMSSTPST